MVFRGSGGIMFQNGKRQPVASIETFARFQAGFLSSEDFHRISEIFIDLLGFWNNVFEHAPRSRSADCAERPLINW